MDTRFNKPAAIEALIRHTEARGKSDIGTDYQQLLEVDIDKLEIVPYTKPDTYRLCKFDEISNNRQEVILRIQGILCATELPPLKELIHESQVKKIRGLRQAVQLTGLGEDIFGSIIRTIEKIHQKFELSLPVNTLESFQRGEYEGTLALHAHNRYFTDRRVAPQQEHQPFLPMVDPYGALDKLRSQTFIHSCDNIVEYTSLRKDGKGNDEYFVINPATFGLGDIVEISVAFVCIPIINGYKLMTTLRGMVLLDNSVRKKALTDSKAAQVPTLGPALTLKRKMLYIKDQLEETCDTVSAMTLQTPSRDSMQGIEQNCLERTRRKMNPE